MCVSTCDHVNALCLYGVLLFLIPIFNLNMSVDSNFRHGVNLANLQQPEIDRMCEYLSYKYWLLPGPECHIGVVGTVVT